MSHRKACLTHARLKEVLGYDSSTGLFTWKIRVSNRIKVGDVAGTPHSHGYITIKIDGKLYLAHRLAWFYQFGSWPISRLDHRDTIRTHNWIDNLRLASASQNLANTNLKSNNKTGFKGVSKRRNGYRATINIAGKQVHLGDYSDALLAAEAYRKAAISYFGEFARHDQDKLSSSE